MDIIWDICTVGSHVAEGKKVKDKNLSDAIFTVQNNKISTPTIVQIN